MVRTVLSIVIACVALAPLTPVRAGKQPGSKTPVVVTFRDCHGGIPSPAYGILDPASTCPNAEDRIGSEWGQPYVDGEFGVEAFLGTQATSGNILLNLMRSSRELKVEFSDCASAGLCRPPAATRYTFVSLRVDATAVRKYGILGMAVGETMSSPVRVTYATSPEESPGFIDFNPSVAPRGPCKGAADYASVTRTGVETWEVFTDASRIACVTLSDGAGWGGNYHFPFRAIVRVK